MPTFWAMRRLSFSQAVAPARGLPSFRRLYSPMASARSVLVSRPRGMVARFRRLSTSRLRTWASSWLMAAASSSSLATSRSTAVLTTMLPWASVNTLKLSEDSTSIRGAGGASGTVARSRAAISSR
jgi:hypothetical protein